MTTTNSETVDTMAGRDDAEKVDTAYAIFLADSHLFNPSNTAAQNHLHVLDQRNADTVYLVGDTIDFKMILEYLVETHGFNPQTFPAKIEDVFAYLEDGFQGFPDLEMHLRVFDVLFAKIAQGATIKYLPGLHDESMETFDGLEKYGMHFTMDDVFRTLDGQDFLVEHGYRFDEKGQPLDQSLNIFGRSVSDRCTTIDRWLGRTL